MACAVPFAQVCPSLPSKPRGPYRPTRMRQQALHEVLKVICCEEAATPSGVAAALRMRGIPPPGRVPWSAEAAARLLQIGSYDLEAGKAALTRQETRRVLANRLRALALHEARRVLLGPHGTWAATAARLRRSVTRTLAASPELRSEADNILIEVAPEVGMIVMREGRQRQGGVPLARVLNTGAPRWRLEELMESQGRPGAKA